MIQPSSSRRALAALVSVVALGASGGLAACGGSSLPKPAQSALAAKLKSESDLQSFSDSQIDCVAAVVRRYGNATSLDQYVAGKITANQLTGSDESTVQSKLTSCLRSSGG